MKKWIPRLAVWFAMCVVSLGNAVATTFSAASYSDLTTSVTSAVSGDTISITADIVVSAAVTLNKSLTIAGNNHTVTVPVNGLSDAGIFNGSPSAFRVFSVSGASVVVTINNLTVKGGNTVGGGGAITVASGATLRFYESAIANSRNSASGGGGLYNAGTSYIINSRLMRNSAAYGGGFLNLGGATMYVEGSTVMDNRSESSSGGGGAGENEGTLYVNNSTFSNNKSTEIGGAINNYRGVLYALNSTFSGNVGYGTLTAGGAIGNNNGTVTVINSLFAYNYVRNGGTATNPTSFALDDVSKYSGSGTTNSYYCIFQGSTADHNVAVSNVHYLGLANGSDNTIFSGGTLTQITDGTGAVIGTGQVFQPFLVNTSNTIAALLQPAGFAQANLGTQSGYSSSGTPVVGYYNTGTSAWVTIAGSNPQNNIVVLDQLGSTRSNPPVRGAVESSVSNVYMLKVNAAANGTVNGGSLYGDIYPANTQVVLTPIPNSGYQFSQWNDTSGSLVSTSNPYTVTVNSNITLVPVFSVQVAGQYTITYIGNGNTGGTGPATNTYSAPTTIADSGTLVNAGYTFAGWNTSSNGSGTAYAVGSTYSAGNNLTLYAQWTLIPTYSVTYNGNTNTGGSVPTDGNTYAAGATVTVLGNTGTLVKTGYTFAGWNTAANGSGTNYAGGATFTMGSANVTLYAQWTAAPTCYAAPSATGTGTITACFTGGGAGCGFTVSQFIPLTGNAASPPAGSAPAGITFPQGLFDFTASACTPGSVLNFTITYPQPLPPGTQYEKYGPTSTNTTPHWYALPAVISGNTITFSITDGGLGDDDLLANNGSIVDPGGPFVPPPFVAVAIPTLSEWALALLALLLLGFGAQRVRCRR